MPYLPDAFFPVGTISYMVAFAGGGGAATSTPTIVGSPVDATPTSWWLTCPEAPGLATPIDPRSVRMEQPRNSVVADQAGKAIAVTSAPLSTRIDLEIWALSALERQRITAVCNSGLVIRIISVLGDQWNTRCTSGISWEMLRLKPTPAELTPIRDAHVATVSFTEVHYVAP